MCNNHSNKDLNNTNNNPSQSEFDSFYDHFSADDPVSDYSKTFKDVMRKKRIKKAANSFGSIGKVGILIFILAFIPFLISFGIKIYKNWQYKSLSNLPKTDILSDINVNFSGISPYITAEIDEDSEYRYKDYKLTLSKKENISKGEKIKLYITADKETLIRNSINIEPKEKEIISDIDLEWVTVDHEFTQEEIESLKSFVENHFEAICLKNKNLAKDIIRKWVDKNQKIVDYDNVEIINHKFTKFQVLQTNEEKGSGKDIFFGDYKFSNDLVAAIETTVKTNKGETYLGYVNITFKNRRVVT